MVFKDAGVWLPERGPGGSLQVDSSKFPSGLANLSTYLEGKGLMLGLYTDLSNRDVGNDC